MKTVILQNCAREYVHIFDFLCKTSKNIKNICLFTHTFYERYKNIIYKDVFTYVNDNLSNINSYEDVNNYMLKSLKEKFSIYTDNYSHLKSNDDIIYKQIKSYIELNNVMLTNNNYYGHKNVLINLLKTNMNLVIPDQLEDIYFNKILNSKLEYIYNKEYFSIKKAIQNNIPYDSKNTELINSVKINCYLFANKKEHKINYKQWANELLHFKFNHVQSSLNKLQYLETCFGDLKSINLELVKFCFKLKTKKEYTIFDKGLIEIVLCCLKRIILKIKINDVYDTNLFEKINSKISNITFKNLHDIFDMKILKNLCKDVINLNKLIDTEIKKLKIEHDKEIHLVYAKDIFFYINQIRMSLLNNNLDIEKDLLKLKQLTLNIDIDNLVDELTNNICDVNKIYILLEQIIKKLGLTKEINNLTSDQSLIQTLTRENINSSNNNKIPSDVINNIMNKVQQSINSFYEKKKNDKKCNYPKYLNKNENNNVHWLKDYGMKYDGKYITLFMGEHVNNNLNDFTEEYNVLLQEGKYNSKYIKYGNIKKHKKNTNKGKSFTYKNKNEKIYIPKNSDDIIDGGYVKIKMPSLPKDVEEITQLEIVPCKKDVFNIHITYKLKEKYVETQEIQSASDGISIDLGIINLLTIYDPVGKQHIIKGGKIVSTNEYYVKKIGKIQKELSLHNLYESKRLTNAYKKRENVLEYMFNQITKWIFERYGNKKFIVIGYNVGWKESPKMGRNTRRKFCQIPFRKLINKIFEKGKEKGILIKETNEAYTSKCDALMGEKVCKHEEYTGTRKYRGMFLSGIGKTINADINGAINIMRKYCENKGIKHEGEINRNVYNPVIERIERYDK